MLMITATISRFMEASLLTRLDAGRKATKLRNGAIPRTEFFSVEEGTLMDESRDQAADRRKRAQTETSMAWQYKGVFPALQCPFNPDLSIDEQEMRKFAAWLAGIKGIGGLVTNGHTGEVFALSAKQRAQATRLAVEAAGGKVPVISAG